MKYCLGNFCNPLVQFFFWIFSPELAVCFVKMIRNDQTPNVVSTPLIYEIPWEEKESRKFWPVINSVKWLIVYSHQDDEKWNEWQLLPWKQKRWNSNTSNRTIYEKWIVSRQVSHTKCLRRASRHWWKAERVLVLGVFSSTTESCMIITNIPKTINLEGQWIYVNQKHIGGNNFPHLLKSKTGCEIWIWKWSPAFLGAKRVSHSSEGRAAPRKFDCSDSSERFCTNVCKRKY